MAALGKAATVVAIVVIAAWLALGALLLAKVEASDATWARLLLLFNSVQAVAFGAAGAMFGTTIQKQRVQQAEARASEAAQRADAVTDKGRALVRFIEKRAQGGQSASGAGSPHTALADEELLTLAHTLFPE